MRHVERVACPADLDGASSVGGIERAAAISFFEAPENARRRFEFSAYRCESVKTALETMFGFKCAYCESDYSATQPPDVEHYRPKGAIVGADGRLKYPGYYWLAADWSNLLPSCIDCNRKREQEVDDEPRRQLGKGNRFPLDDECQRAQRPGEESDELPLLLDPCRDDPEEHLEFVEAGVVRAALLSGTPSRRGEHTIDVVGLGRLRLQRKRAAHLVRVDAMITRYREAVEDFDESPNSARCATRLARETSELKRMMDTDAEYSLMAQQRIAAALPDLLNSAQNGGE